MRALMPQLEQTEQALRINAINKEVGRWEGVLRSFMSFPRSCQLTSWGGGCLEVLSGSLGVTAGPYFQLAQIILTRPKLSPWTHTNAHWIGATSQTIAPSSAEREPHCQPARVDQHLPRQGQQLPQQLLPLRFGDILRAGVGDDDLRPVPVGDVRDDAVDAGRGEEVGEVCEDGAPWTAGAKGLTDPTRGHLGGGGNRGLKTAVGCVCGCLCNNQKQEYHKCSHNCLFRPEFQDPEHAAPLLLLPNVPAPPWAIVT